MARGYALGLLGDGELPEWPEDSSEGFRHLGVIRSVLIAKGLLAGGANEPGPLDAWRKACVP